MNCTEPIQLPPNTQLCIPSYQSQPVPREQNHLPDVLGMAIANVLVTRNRIEEILWN
jgi:hypothetical protein